MSTKLNWKPVIASLLQHLQTEGFKIKSVDNGDGEVTTRTEAEAIAEICATDQSCIFVTHGDDTRKYWLLIVLGNTPSETVSDYSIPMNEFHLASLENAIGSFSQAWENKDCSKEGEISQEVARELLDFALAFVRRIERQGAVDWNRFPADNALLEWQARAAIAKVTL